MGRAPKLDDDPLRDAKRLTTQRNAMSPPAVEDASLTAFGDATNGLAPGVDLDDNAALLELMEDDEASPERS